MSQPFRVVIPSNGGAVSAEQPQQVVKTINGNRVVIDHADGRKQQQQVDFIRNIYEKRL